MVILALSASYIYFLRFHSGSERVQLNLGLVLKSPNLWIDSADLSYFCNVAGTVVCAFLMIAINRLFNVLRTVSEVFVGFFFLFQVSVPAYMGDFSGGIIFAVLILLATMLLYSSYQEPDLTRRVFLVFFLLAFGSLFEYGFLFFIPLFLFGCYQVRNLSPRGLVAVFLGLITPFWILWGFDLIHLSDFHTLPPPDFTGFFNFSDSTEISVAVLFATGTAIVTGVMNLLKVISFNNRSRVYFSFLSALGVLAALLCVVDCNNILFYTPLLYCMTAMQGGMFMRLYQDSRAYILFPVILGVNSLIYIWSLIN